MKDFNNIIEEKKLLVVDDEGFTRSVLAGILRHIGCKNVHEAKDGAGAFRLLEEGGFDVVFCDWEMPSMNGIELFENLKQNEKLGSLHFVMVTGNASPDKVKEAISQGVKEYVVKPFNEKTIEQKLKQCFS